VANKDRSVRFLSALGGASTSRVFNLHRIAQDNGDDPEYSQKPLFASPIINRSFILKHRTRADESYMFASPRTVSTKIIIPFDNDDLKAGGYGLFVDQRGYAEALRNAGHYNSETLDRDMTVLKLLNALPSLDPFLLREHLRNNEIDVAPCYFAISDGDRDRMYRFTERELSRLLELAGASSGSSKLISAMLSSQVDEKLEPLRVTLGLSGNDFREGVFSWRGFLYYKWSMTDFWPDVMKVLKEINAYQPTGLVTGDQRAYLAEARRSIIQMVRDNGDAVTQSLSVYDNAFSDLVAHQSPKTFRDFLLSAPYMFLEMGEKLGAIAHIVSFWRFRFPPGVRTNVDAEELSAIFNDFTSGFGDRMKESRRLKRPMVIDRSGTTPTLYEVPAQIGKA
jgi:hypothetical protein